jgi:hypothetical protein
MSTTQLRGTTPTVFAKDKLARQRKIKKADFEARWRVNRDRRRETYHWRILKLEFPIAGAVRVIAETVFPLAAGTERRLRCFPHWRPKHSKAVQDNKHRIE